MRQRTWLAGLAMLALLGVFELSSCRAREVPLEEEPAQPERKVPTGAAGAAGAFSVPPPAPANRCAFKPDPVGGPYGFCAPGAFGIFVYDYPSDCDGTGHMWPPDIPGACMACECFPSCETDDDCPTPDGGTIMPVCASGRCELPCGNLRVCPQGMRCIPRFSDGNFCAWVADTENSFTCGLTQGVLEPVWELEGNGCSGFTTRESCEARLEADPHRPSAACVWATESIYSTADRSCELLLEKQHCILAESFGITEDKAVVNRCGDRSVFWAELDDQTASLLVMNQCGFYPSQYERNLEGGYRACELGDPSIPLLCECGCLE